MKIKLDNFLNSTLRPLLAENKPSFWIFGYGSLIWNPGFEFETQTKARLRGYSRRFYQGNTTYRGTVDRPGRVVTIVEHQDELTYGLAFKVEGWSQVAAALDHLHYREIQSGYVYRVVTLELLDKGETVQALTCVALQDNALYMAPSSSDQSDSWTKQMAFEIATRSGKGGPNHEYLSRLADSMRSLFPHAQDDHLFQLEKYMLTFMQSSIDCSELTLKLAYTVQAS